MKTNSFIEYFAKIPFLWDIFEFIFGADKQKQFLYRSKFTKKVKMMDFGCSSGNTTSAFLDFDYTGVDIDKQSIEHAKKKWKDYPNIKFVCADVLRPNRKIGKYDAILFAGTGHHLSSSLLLKIFSRLGSMLNRGGEIHYFDTIKPTPSSSFLTRWICSIDRGGNIRSKSKSLFLIKQLYSKYKLIDLSVEKVSGTYIPQPKYLYVRLKKRT